MTFRLYIKTDNAAYNELLNFELARQLDAVAARLRANETHGTIKDVNGNTVGDFALTPR